MPARRKSKSTRSARSGPARPAKGSMPKFIVPGAIAVVIVLVALVWLASSTGHASPIHATTITVNATVNAAQSSSGELSAQDIITLLSPYQQPQQFTANYTGSIYTAISTGAAPITGNLTAEYERYNNSARSYTDIVSSQAGVFKTMTYYSNNGIAYACAANSTSRSYICQSALTKFNASDFGLSMLLSAMSNSSSRTISVSNSSYRGTPCIGISSRTNSSYNNSGVIIATMAQVSGCIEPRYRIPLLLNFSSLSIASGTYFNGTTKTKVPPVSESLMVNMRLTGITNSSSQSEVQSLPANAVTVG